MNQKPEVCSVRDVGDEVVTYPPSEVLYAEGPATPSPASPTPRKAQVSALLPLVALTPSEAADLLEMARAGAADDHSAAALLGHLAALVDRARLHTNRQDTDL